MKFKKIALITGKGFLTVIAFIINPAFGICVGAVLFFGIEVFATK